MVTVNYRLDFDPLWRAACRDRGGIDLSLRPGVGPAVDRDRGKLLIVSGVVFEPEIDARRFPCFPFRRDALSTAIRKRRKATSSLTGFGDKAPGNAIIAIAQARRLRTVVEHI
jgi:hypothetical protein